MGVLDLKVIRDRRDLKELKELKGKWELRGHRVLLEPKVRLSCCPDEIAVLLHMIMILNQWQFNLLFAK